MTGLEPGAANRAGRQRLVVSPNVRRLLIFVSLVLALAGCDSNSDADRTTVRTGERTRSEVQRFYVRMEDDAAALQVAVSRVLKGDSDAVDRVTALHKRIRARLYDYLVANGDRPAGFLLLDLAAVGARAEADTGDLDGLKQKRTAIVNAREKLAQERSAAFCEQSRGACGPIALERGDELAGTPIGRSQRDRLIVAGYDRLLRGAGRARRQRRVDMRRVAPFDWSRMFVFAGFTRAQMRQAISDELGFDWQHAPPTSADSCRSGADCAVLLVFATRHQVVAAVSRYEFGALICLDTRALRPRQTRLTAYRTGLAKAGNPLPGAHPVVLLIPPSLFANTSDCRKDYGVLR
jgi:hypothetical protein